MSNSNSNSNSDKKPVVTDLSSKNPDEIFVQLGNKRVPWSSINKPHAVVHPEDHQPKVDANAFPDVEPEVKQKENLKEFDQAVLQPGVNKPQVDVNSFPDIEPEAKEREEKLAAQRAKKNE
ncbi:hypothetical protein Cantr_03287 [Candida viswanathii]|uniref:Uncharacterized protein n=1 Tax=Candida viswanathii TaxID=5486 RepID=A0A367YMJ6_9ASCO|nr:hypothetical protein Cantr_03287 [Candida viswanathii]